MVVRTQVTLAAETHRLAKQRAGELGISFAELVRRAIDREVGEQPPSTDPSELFGLFDSGGSDISRDKDALLGQAVGQLHPERGR